MPEYEALDVANEREDVYRKLKDGFNFIASIMVEDRESLVHRLRAVRIQSELARTLRLYLNDAENLEALKERVTELEKRLT